MPGGPHGLQNRWDPDEGSGGFDSHPSPPIRRCAAAAAMPWRLARAIAAGAPTARDDQPADRRGRGRRARRPAARTRRPAGLRRRRDGRLRGGGPGPLAVTGRVMAGPTAPGEVGPGQAVEIATGAPVPWAPRPSSRTSRPRAQAPGSAGRSSPDGTYAAAARTARRARRYCPRAPRSLPWFRGWPRVSGQTRSTYAGGRASPSWSPGTSSPPPAFRRGPGARRPRPAPAGAHRLGRRSAGPPSRVADRVRCWPPPSRPPARPTSWSYAARPRRAPPTTCARSSASGGGTARRECGLPAGSSAATGTASRPPAGRRPARQPVRGAGRGADPPHPGPRCDDRARRRTR